MNNLSKNTLAGRLLCTAIVCLSVSFCLQAAEQTEYKGKPFKNHTFAASPQVIPGKIMCAYYDTGGEGIAYHETTEQNMGSGRYNPANGTYLNEFRMAEGVDISYTKKDMDYTDKNLFIPELGMLYVGWTAPGEWINYTVEVKETGKYMVQLLYSAARDGMTSLSVDGKGMTETLKLPSTESPHVWNCLEDMAEISLEKGVHVLTLYTGEVGGMNYAWLNFIQKQEVQSTKNGN